MFSKEKQFEQLFRENYSRLYRYALDFLGEPESAKDMVSELFSDLWRKRNDYTPENYKSYLYRALRNRCINHLRHLSVENDAMQHYVEESRKMLDDDPELHEERLQSIEKLIGTMPEKTRFILEQCYLKGHKYSEVAQMAGTTAPMVHKHISKALALLRKTLNSGRTKNSGGGTEKKN